MTSTTTQYTDNDGTSILHWAAFHSQTGPLALLLRCTSLPLDGRNVHGHTPLHWAAIAGSAPAAAQLIGAGADVLVGDAQGQCALHHAAQYGSIHVALILLRLPQFGAEPQVVVGESGGVSVWPDGVTAAPGGLVRATWHFVTESIMGRRRAALGTRAQLSATPVDVADGVGHTPLHWAAYRNQTQMISLLLQHGADVNAVDDDGMSALHWASLRGNLGAARALLLAGARYDLKDVVDGATARVMAKNKGHGSIVSLLERVEAVGPDAASDQLSPAEWWAAALLPFWLGPGLMATLSYTPLYLSLLTLASSGVGVRILRNHRVLAPAARSNPLLVGVFVALFTFSLVVYQVWVRSTFGFFEPVVNDWLFLLLAVATGVSVVGVGLMDPGTLPSDAPAPNDMETVVRDELRQALTAVPTASASSRGNRSPTPTLCVTCRRRRPPRSKHCRVCRRCVSNMDHHCIWINNCVGAGNHGAFLAALAIATVTHSLYLITLVKLVATGWTAAPDAPDAVAAAAAAAAVPLGTPFVWLSAHWAVHPLVMWNLPLHAFMVFWMGALFTTQLQQATKNLLTNEVINAHRYEGFGVAGGGGHSHSLRAIKSPYDTGSALGNFKALMCPTAPDASE